MSGIVAIVLLVLCPAAIFAARARRPGGLLLATFVGSIFAAGVQWPVSQRLVFFTLALLVYFRAARTGSVRRSLLAQALALIALLTMVIVEIATPIEYGSERELWVRYFIILPLCLIAGVMMTIEDREILSRAFVYFAMINAVVALIEFVFRTRFIQTVILPSSNEFGFRSGVAAEHPLVLACLLAAAAPFVEVRGSHKVRGWLTLAVLFLASATTGSGGVTVVLALYIALRIAKLDLALAKSRALPYFGVGTLAVLLIAGRFVNYNDPLISAVGDSASDIYRVVLYAFSSQVLSDAPLGWGLTGVPTGVYVIPSVYGPLDLARTIDSEYVLLITQLGWFGIAIAVSLMLIPWINQTDPRLRWSIFIVLVTGFFLALHAWIGLSSMIMVLLGNAMNLTNAQGRRGRGEPARQVSKFTGPSAKG